ncbi:ComEC/Rec2 family competence protein [Pedobacter sp. MC2016-15]|uniref:ComEC/Rec2 family competence protein n=1 Tax=Pedobacter sp. MC2016-15 TaxID=2994473 RepID=UPI002246E801|nr:ComEC/Rec2 family competence protein [Pedobacter sp. MC2016-15]MCX2478075.1 ComEC/Rec2 family competence protein [Pedobacter sp. MC2016-15]
MASKSPLKISIRILAAFCAGISVLHYCDFTKLNLFIHILLILDLLLLFIFNYLYKSLKVYNHKPILTFLLLMCFFLLGASRTLTHPDTLNSDHFSEKKAAFLKIYVDEEPRETAGSLRFRARVISPASGGLLMLSIRSGENPFPAVTYGQVYLIPARFKEIPAPRNPGEFDSKTWMANQHIYHQAFLSGTELVPLHQQMGSPLLRYTLAVRKEQVELYRKLIRNNEAFAVAATLILGYRADLDAETMAAYSRTGTIHALSVSGMHVALVYLVLEYALAWMNRRTFLKWMKMLIIISLIWFYTLITGCSASVLRSAIMLSMLILTKVLRRNSDGYHVLTVSAFCLLFNEPALLWDVGFQLSYLAVLGLIYLQPGIFALITFTYWPLQQVWSIISVSLAAQLFTWPLSIYYFHQFPVYFLLSNLFITLPVTILMYIGLSILIFRFYWLSVPFEWLLTFMNKGLSKIAGLPYSTINQIWISEIQLLLFSAALLLLLRAFSEKTISHLFGGLVLLILFQASLLRDKTAAHQQMVIIFYAINKHYAAAFLQGNKALVLTSLSPGTAAFKYHIQPALDQRKIVSISIQRKSLTGDHLLRFGKFRILLPLHGRFVAKIDKDTLNFKNSVLVFKQIKASLVNLKKI